MPNRFYRPSTPQYTSQFVEDKYPLQEMLVSQRYKAAKKEQVAAQYGQLEALNASITAGARTQDIAPSVKNYWNKRLADSADKISGMSVQEATRNLSRLRNEWMNDPNVQLIRRDREEGDPEYATLRRSKTYGTDIKPFWDEQEGRVSQFGFAREIEGVEQSADANQGYTPYETMTYTADYVTPLNQLLSKLPTNVKEEKGIEKWTDPTTGKVTSSPYNVSVEYRDKEKDRESIEAMAENIYASKDAGAWQNYFVDKLGLESEKDVENFIWGEYEKFETRKERTRRYLPKGKKEEKEPGRITIPTAQYEIPSEFKTSFGGLTGKGGVSAFRSVEFTGYDKAYKRKDGSYKFDLNDPEELVSSEGKLRYATAIQPDLTKKTLEEYFHNRIEEEKNREKGERDWKINQLENWRDKQLKWVEKVIDRYYDIDEVSDEAIQNTHNKMILTGELDKDVLASGKFDDRKTVAKADKEHEEKFAGLGYSADIEMFSPDEVEELTSTFGGSFIRDGKIDSDKARSLALTGARMIKLSEPDEEVDKKARLDLFGEDNIFEVKGFLKDNSSLWGPGLMIINTSDGIYAMEGSKEYVEQARLPYMLTEYSRMMSGIGRPFAVNSVDPQTGVFIIADPYNSSRRRARDDSAWFDVKYNYGDILVDGVENSEPYELRKWTGNPEDEKSVPEIIYKSKNSISKKMFRNALLDLIRQGQGQE